MEKSNHFIERRGSGNLYQLLIPHEWSYNSQRTPMGKVLLERLTGGDRRSIGQANEIVKEVLRTPQLFTTLFEGLHDDNPLIRMRTADALEKITAQRPAWLAPYKYELLRLLAAPEQPEVRWHLIQMAPRLHLTLRERAKTISVLKNYLSDNSSIVKTSAMQTIAELAGNDEHLRTDTISLLERLVKTGTPAMKSRGRKLLKSFGIENPHTT